MFSKTVTIIFVAGLCFIMSLANILVSAKMSHLGSDLMAIEYQKDALRKSLTQTKQTIATKTALLDLSTKAEVSGFVPTTQMVVIASPASVALHPLSPNF